MVLTLAMALLGWGPGSLGGWGRGWWRRRAGGGAGAPSPSQMKHQQSQMERPEPGDVDRALIQLCRKLIDFWTLFDGEPLGKIP